MARKRKVSKAAVAMAVAVASVLGAQGAALAGPVRSTNAAHPSATHGLRFSPAITSNTGTPIKHLVVIFQENVSFDHYFGTYPERGQPAW